MCIIEWSVRVWVNKESIMLKELILGIVSVIAMSALAFITVGIISHVYNRASETASIKAINLSIVQVERQCD